jgi:murein L,D-transpeptidase YafK
MYKKSVGKRFIKFLVVVILVGSVGALIVMHTRAKQFFLYLDARVSQEASASTSGGKALVVYDPAILVKKSQRRLLLLDGDSIAASYDIGLGFAPVGDKECEGDGKTPEGAYYVCTKNPNSKYHLSLGINYPNAADAEAGYLAGLISEADRDRIVFASSTGETPLWNTALGGEIFIHGHGSKRDWTAGCVAMNDADMDQLYESIPLGTPVQIDP